jgi:hypothetical protein
VRLLRLLIRLLGILILPLSDVDRKRETLWILMMFSIASIGGAANIKGEARKDS